jgi:hypothetical protein
MIVRHRSFLFHTYTCITGLLTKVKHRMPLVEQELLTVHSTGFHPRLIVGFLVAQSLGFCVVICWTLSFCLYSFGYCLFSPLNYDFWLPLLVSPNFSYLVSRSTPVRSISRHFLRQCIKYTLYEASSQQGHYLYLNIRNCVISKLMNINYLNMQDAFIMVYVVNMEKNGLHQTGNVCKLSAA